MAERPNSQRRDELRLAYEAADAAFREHATLILNSRSLIGDQHWNAEWDRLKALMEEALEAWRRAED